MNKNGKNQLDKNQLDKNQVYIQYSNCHEDSLVLTKAIDQYLNDQKIALSIASAGDNSFSLLTKGFTKVVIFDKNPIQLALTKLKATAIKYLEYSEMLVFLGINLGDSLSLYKKISGYLDHQTREYFNENIELIQSIKLIHCGRFEQYFQYFKQRILPLIIRKRAIEKLVNSADLTIQQQNYRKFNNFRLKILFKVFFSKKILAKKGRKAEYFKYAKGNLVTNLKKRIDYGFNNILLRDNPYFQYVLTNQYLSLPEYLKPENFEIIKNNIDNLEFIEGDLATVFLNTDQKISFFNLSDIFEYLSEEETIDYQKIIIKIAQKNSLIVFWNMMVDRKFTLDNFKQLDSTKLFNEDRAFFYQKLLLYEVINND